MEWFEIAKTFGLPVTLLLILLFGVMRTVKWLATNIVKPAFDRHMKFLDQVEANLVESEETLKQMSLSLKALSDRFDDHLVNHPHASTP